MTMRMRMKTNFNQKKNTACRVQPIKTSDSEADKFEEIT